MSLLIIANVVFCIIGIACGLFDWMTEAPTHFSAFMWPLACMLWSLAGRWHDK